MPYDRATGLTERHKGLHLFEDLVITEVVDEKNRPVSPGAYGDKVLMTVLFGRTQPLIRYGMSDSIKPASSPRAFSRTASRAFRSGVNSHHGLAGPPSA